MKRQSNIELLRIFAIIGVVFLHYYNGSIGGASAMVVHSSFNFLILNFFESTFICAVNVFILICGYFLSRTYTRNFIKPIQLLVEVTVINIGYTLMDSLLTKDFNITALISSFVPSNWFVILYIVLFIVSPYINIVIDTLSLKKFKHLLLLGVMIFSIIPTFFDFISEAFGVRFQISPIGMYGNQEGYTIINFMLMYLIGAYLAKCNISKIKTRTLLLLILLNIGIIFALLYHVKKVALAYCNPFVISEAILFFIFFLNFLKNPTPLSM